MVTATIVWSIMRATYLCSMQMASLVYIVCLSCFTCVVCRWRRLAMQSRQVNSLGLICDAETHWMLRAQSVHLTWWWSFMTQRRRSSARGARKRRIRHQTFLRWVTWSRQQVFVEILMLQGAVLCSQRMIIVAFAWLRQFGATKRE